MKFETQKEINKYRKLLRKNQIPICLYCDFVLSYEESFGKHLFENHKDELKKHEIDFLKKVLDK